MILESNMFYSYIFFSLLSSLFIKKQRGTFRWLRVTHSTEAPNDPTFRCQSYTYTHIHTQTHIYAAKKSQEKRSENSELTSTHSRLSSRFPYQWDADGLGWSHDLSVHRVGYIFVKKGLVISRNGRT